MRWIVTALLALGLASLVGCCDYHRSCRARHGCVGHAVFECPRHAAAASDRPGICSQCTHPLVASCGEDWGPACAACMKERAGNGECRESGPCGDECKGECKEPAPCGGECKGEGEEKHECEDSCGESCPGAKEGNCGKCTGEKAHPCCGKCSKAKGADGQQ